MKKRSFLFLLASTMSLISAPISSGMAQDPVPKDTHEHDCDEGHADHEGHDEDCDDELQDTDVKETEDSHG